MDYQEFLESKSHFSEYGGFEPTYMPDFLIDFQQSLVDWAVRKGRCAIFADCGLGKTPMQLVWAENVVRQTNKNVLILTPLAVSYQTVKEGDKFGIECHKSDNGKPKGRITVTNYEKLHLFDHNDYVGVVCDESSILKNFDAVVLATGAAQPRALNIKGDKLKGVHFAMEFLGKQNQVIGGEIDANPISAKGKHVLVIGGGDTGSDCIGTSNRHGAASITQLELLPKPPKQRTVLNPWPEWPMTLRTSSSHEEGAERMFSILTKEFTGNDAGEVTGLTLVDIEWKEKGGKMTFEEIPGTERTIPCDLAFIAIGYMGPAQNSLLQAFGAETMENSLPKSKNYQSTNPKVFLAGDMRRGQSLVVWAISEGREAAVKVDEFLMGTSSLPQKDESFFQVEEQIAG